MRFCLPVALLLLTTPALAADRAPLPLERAYLGFALDVERHEVCAKISPRAVDRASLSAPGRQVYYVRSHCFMTLARRTGNPHFCQFVTEARAPGLDGGTFTPDLCRAGLADGRFFRASIGFDHKLIGQALGFTDADVKAQYQVHPARPYWTEFYYAFVRRLGAAEFQRRLGRLPDFSAR